MVGFNRLLRFDIRKELKDKTFLLMLISGIVLATGVTYYLISFTNNQEQIITKIDTLQAEAEAQNNTVTVILPIPGDESNATGKISGIGSGGPVIVNLTK